MRFEMNRYLRPFKLQMVFAHDLLNDPWYSMSNDNMMNILDNGIHLAQIISPTDV